MLLIPCPWCGPRDHVEFSYGGDAGVMRPADPAAASDGAWAAYIYLRDNPCGPHVEWWQHHAGCRRWIKLLRDTRSHAILASARAEERFVSPEGGG